MLTASAAGFIPLPAPPDARRASSWFRIARHSRFFEGHFDGAPILPGIAHLALTLIACNALSGVERTLTAVRDVRFRRPIGPDDEVEVVLDGGAESFSVNFEIRCRGEIATSGLLLFEDHES